MTPFDTAYARLNDEQREAVDHVGDTVVLAGPGSGKTDTLMVRAGLLLTRELRPPQGLACITYTRAAAREISNRIGALGLRPGRQLFAGTLHAFCLRMILRPFADLAGEPWLRAPEIATEGTRQSLLAQAMDYTGLNDRPHFWMPTLQRIRRQLACHEDPREHFDARQIATAERYEQNLLGAELVDYDGIIHHAVRLAEGNPRIVDVLTSAFPWLLVDEYQDLGGPLHRLVCLLRDGGTHLFAVGDPDQTIMQFTGADPRYLQELPELGCHQVRLRLNYRSGGRLIAAAAAALGHDRGYEAAPEVTDEGTAESVEVPGGIEAQVNFTVDQLLPSLLAQGIAHEEIALLYPQKSEAVNLLRSALEERAIPHSFERDERFDTKAPVIDWLQRCTQYALGEDASPPIRFRDLSDELFEYLAGTGRPEGRSDLAAAVVLQRAVELAPSRDDLLLDWLNDFLEVTALQQVLSEAGTREEELDALNSLLTQLRTTSAGTTVGAFAGPIRQPDHVVVTTYHSSKGRQFDAVVLPFLQESFMPRYRRRYGEWRPDNLATDRLLFYVAFTRARKRVSLLWSETSGIDPYGNPAGFPRSNFVDEIEAVL